MILKSFPGTGVQVVGTETRQVKPKTDSSCNVFAIVFIIHYFDAVGWATGRASVL